MTENVSTIRLTDAATEEESEKTATEAARQADWELAQRAAAGDRDAFEQIYWRHHRRIFGVCVRMTKDAGEAEDLTQQVFVHLFRKIGSYRGDAAFSTWLHRLTVNQVLMQFRKNKLRREDTTETGELPDAAHASPRRAPGAQDLTNRILLDRAIGQLPEGYRRALVLHDIEGYEHEEIARMTGCAVGTSKSQLHKARKKLRALLNAETEIVHQTLQEIS